MTRGPKHQAVIFGGTFDPFHSGHVAVLRELLSRYFTVAIAPTIQNPDKPRRATAISLRYEMIRRVLEAEKIELIQSPQGCGVFLESHPYCYTPELVQHWREVHRVQVDCAIGADLIDEVPSWNKGWVVKHVPLYVVPVLPDYPRATEIRHGRVEAHPAIADFIREHGLYQTTEDFAALMRAKAEAFFREMAAGGRFPGAGDCLVDEGGESNASWPNFGGSCLRWLV